ncbi:MAG TPA: patatin-like phospholipase family protein, partial [Casimicrobiaceae bacterium]|nr:patatin-like phospholipase family protein [Casimicrobiaceae bacterium]
MLDEVDIITGVSGGSFTALAYGLYGEKLFDQYEKRFLKRNVQGELISRFFNPTKWGALNSTGWGRSELAAQLYDEILFEGATFADLDRGGGPMITVVATDISTGSRLAFTQGVFDSLCSDLGPFPLSRAAARAARRLREFEGYSDSIRRPFIHLVDGGVSDNLGLRGVLEVIEAFEALHSLGQP